MSRTIKIAAVQMFAQPAPVTERLQRAEKLVAEAAGQGAQLVVLPEVFNTGYEYTDHNYTLPEPIDGPTVTWMKQTAAHYGVHLAGTLLLLDIEDVYNTLLLVAPDGRLWRYDKNYPWYWERAYFREGRAITVADTDLGRLGLMICWDAAHPELWARYAGKVDAMVISSCPPTFNEMILVFPDGRRLDMEGMGPLTQEIKRTGAGIFGEKLLRQSAALGVPVVNTTGTGHFSSPVPLPHLSLMIGTLSRPDFWPYLPQAGQVRVEAGYFNETYIASAHGHILAKVPPDTEGCVVSEVTLTDSPPQPRAPQPRFGTVFLTYLLDQILNALMVPVYRRELRRTFGPHMAPVSVQTQTWVAAVLATGLIGYWLGRRRC